MNQGMLAEHNLADHLRRWIIIVGYFLGIWGLLQVVAVLMAWGLPFNRRFQFPLVTLMHRLGTVLWMGAPILLLVGCWAFQNHQRAARTLLLSYAVVWFAALLATVVVQISDVVSGAHGDNTLAEMAYAFFSGLDVRIHASVFPLSVVLVLTRPEIRDQFPEFRRRFEVVRPEQPR